VNVGGQECQTCHGPIETMDVVRQHSLLTMGWCIDCHRKTNVNSKGNAYYDKLIELHKDKKNMTVEDIGGLECSKCHY
jgi:mono/diheme cytochrome c family protein